MNRVHLGVSPRKENRLAKLVRSGRSGTPQRVDGDVRDGWSSEGQLPILRGYPIDQFYANRNNR